MVAQSGINPERLAGKSFKLFSDYQANARCVHPFWEEAHRASSRFIASGGMGAVIMAR